MSTKKTMILTLMLLVAAFASGCQNNVRGKQTFTELVSKEETGKQESENISEILIPEITNVLPGEGGFIALCADGTVWEWDYDRGKENAKQIDSLQGIKKIMDGGAAYYALSQYGDVYVWGSNEEYQINPNGEAEDSSSKAVQLASLKDIVLLDVKNGSGFAVDANDRFFLWGITIHNDERRDSIPYHYNKNALREIDYLEAGTGNYHFFRRSDGSVFSIMEDTALPHIASKYIFPYFDEGDGIKEQRSYLDIDHIKLSSQSGLTEAILYEAGMYTEALMMAADPYTVFIYDKEGNLSYWDNQNITYHDARDFIGKENGKSNVFEGEFVSIDIREVLKIEDGKQTPAITDIICGRENSMFLCSNGQVFISEYTTYAITDITHIIYRDQENVTNSIMGISGLELKKLSFRKVEWEDIVSINTDGEYRFAAVDVNGECLLWDTEDTQDKE